MCNRCKNKSWCICQQHEKCLLFRISKNCVCCETQEYIFKKKKETKSTMNYRKLIQEITKDLIKFYKKENSNDKYCFNKD